MKVCVLGGAGFIGRRVIRQLVSHGHEVICLDLVAPPQEENLPAIRAERLDISSFEDVVASFIRHKPEVVMNLVYMIGEHPPRTALNVNIVGMDNCFEAARLAGVDRVVYASSLAVHGSGQTPYGQAPINEDAPPMPRKQYAVHKAFNEWQAREYREKHGMTITGVRVANVAGLDKVLGSVDHVEAISKPAIGQAARFPFKDRMRCVIHVDDIAAVFAGLALIERPRYPMYHSGGETFSMGELADLVRSLIPDADISFETDVGGREIAEAYFIDNSRVRDELGISYMPYRQRTVQMIEEARRRASM